MSRALVSEFRVRARGRVRDRDRVEVWLKEARTASMECAWLLTTARRGICPSRCSSGAWEGR